MGPVTHPVSNNYASQHRCLCTHPILDLRLRANDVEACARTNFVVPSHSTFRFARFVRVDTKRQISRKARSLSVIPVEVRTIFFDCRFRGSEGALVILDECRRRDGIGFLTTDDGCVCFTWAEPRVPFAPGGVSSDRLRHRLLRRGVAWPLLWPAREPNEGHRPEYYHPD